jgi:hypothetical protein
MKIDSAKSSCATAREWQHPDAALLWSWTSPLPLALRPHYDRGRLRCKFEETASRKPICRAREPLYVAGPTAEPAGHGHFTLGWCFFQNIRPEISDRTVREIVVVS